ncbi:MAG: MarR family transcriptional regulator [Anaerolineae bacterium]|nr:MarR family transcriptional regulator [Anaerolineae bacterium]
MRIERRGGFLISQIHHLSGRIFAQKLQEYQIEINPAQGRIMFVLWENDGLPINELAKKTSLAKSTLTSMLDRLEESGHLMRAPSQEDRRQILVHRTEKDRAWQAAYMEVSRKMGELFYSGFEESEVDVFERSLQRILDNLTEHESTVAPMREP